MSLSFEVLYYIKIIANENFILILFYVQLIVLFLISQYWVNF